MGRSWSRDARALADRRVIIETYASWFNLRHGMTGHLFGERFRSNPVEKETYARRLERYIVRNPVKEKMAARPEDLRLEQLSRDGRSRAGAGVVRGRVSPAVLRD
ncbi:MAG: transposase [Thermoanaerobaculia bacterium]